jgi:hypothetical protein
VSRQPRHRKEPRHRLDGPADTGHAATALVLPVLLGGVLLLVAVSSGHWSYLMHHLPKWPVTDRPNGFTLLTLGLIFGVGYAGWRLLARVETSLYDDVHDYIDGDYDLDPPEAYELEQAARRPFLENLRVGAAHYFGRRLVDLDGPEPEDPWFGCRADKVQAGFVRDLWLTEPSRAPRYDNPDDEPEW